MAVAGVKAAGADWEERPTMELDQFEARWVSARAGESFHYATGPSLRSEHPTIQRTYALRDAGLATFTTRQGADGRRRHIIVKCKPGSAVQAEPVQRDRFFIGTPEGRVLLAVEAAAEAGMPCPSNAELADLAELRDADAASYRLRKLEDRGHVRIAYRDGGRVVTVVDSWIEHGQGGDREMSNPSSSRPTGGMEAAGRTLARSAPPPQADGPKVSALAMPAGARGFGIAGQAVMLLFPKRDDKAPPATTGLVLLTRGEAEQLHGALGEALAAFGVGEGFTSQNARELAMMTEAGVFHEVILAERAACLREFERVYDRLLDGLAKAGEGEGPAVLALELRRFGAAIEGVRAGLHVRDDARDDALGGAA